MTDYFYAKPLPAIANDDPMLEIMPENLVSQYVPSFMPPSEPYPPIKLSGGHVFHAVGPFKTKKARDEWIARENPRTQASCISVMAVMRMVAPARSGS